MSADADHEVIDSPGALFRHLYEEHGVEEARELDPETAPLQFWLRRHADLERAQRAGHRQPGPPPEPPARPGQRPRAEPRPQPAPQRSQPQGAGREGRRQAGFGDPLVEAVARALAGRGYDETTVRSAIRSFTANGRGPSGEAAVRAALVEPMLRSAAERLLGAPRSTRPADRRPDLTGPPRAADRQADAPRPSRAAEDPRPAPPAPARAPDPVPPPPPRREEPVRPEAAWAVLWADLADSGRRPGGGPGATDDEGDDLMAVANAVQARRRVRLLRR
jgi:hypothetical protein